MLKQGNRVIYSVKQNNKILNTIRQSGSVVYRYEPAIYHEGTAPTTPTYGIRTVSGATNATITITRTGWYKLTTSAAKTGGSENTGAYNSSYYEGWAWLVVGDSVLLWGASGMTTGHPNPSDKYGGCGATGHSEGGGGGGGAGNNGRARSHSDGGNGAAGSGVVVTRIYRGVAREITLCLAAGNGGHCGSNDGSRSSGGGGGAMGNGGSTYSVAVAATSGPLGDWGKGDNGTHYGVGAMGAACFRDETTNTYTWNKNRNGGAGTSTISYYFEPSPVTETIDCGSLTDDNITRTIDCGAVVENDLYLGYDLIAGGATIRTFWEKDGLLYDIKPTTIDNIGTYTSNSFTITDQTVRSQLSASGITPDSGNTYNRTLTRSAIHDTLISVEDNTDLVVMNFGLI